jgi:hypothetical protein
MSRETFEDCSGRDRLKPLSGLDYSSYVWILKELIRARRLDELITLQVVIET